VAGQIPRRKALKRLGAGAALAWTAPILTSLRVPAFAQSPSCVLAAHMEGAQEVPPVPTPGRGTFHGERIAPDHLHYTYSWSNLLGNANAAHIHKAPPGMNGPIVIPLATPSGQSGSREDEAMADPALLDDICANPGEYYVNVHTDLYPGGEIRGQLIGA
jgi:hypothetical protein